MACFTDLPNEIIFSIVALLPYPEVALRNCDLAALALTSRHLHRLVDPILYACNKNKSRSSAVIWAARHGRIETLEKAFCFGLNLAPMAVRGAIGPHDSTMVMKSSIFYAIEGGHEAVVVWLVDHGVELDSPSTLKTGPACHESSALFVALRLKKASIANLLIDRGACTEFKPPKNGHILEDYLTDRGEPKAMPPVSALHYASQVGLVAVARHLVEHKGININAEDCKGYTCLNYAAHHADTSTIAELIKLGADVNWRNGTPLCSAIQGGNFKNAFALISVGSRLEGRSYNGKTPIHMCTRAKKIFSREFSSELDGQWESDQESLLRLLIQRGVDIEGKSRLVRFRRGGRRVSERTVLGEAVEGGTVEAVEILIEAGVDVGRDIGNGNPPVNSAFDRYSMAVDFESADTPDKVAQARLMMVLLLRSGARLDSRGCDGQTLLEQVVHYPGLLDFLLSLPARKILSTEYVDKLLHNCVKRNNSTSFNILLKHGAELPKDPADVVSWIDELLRYRFELHDRFKPLLKQPEHLILRLLDSGLEFNQLDKLFRQALTNRDEDVVNIFLDWGINGRGSGSCDPNVWLQEAAAWGHMRVPPR
ncbi:hypothetical protein AAE478_001191 [Parahypoxylon ruwenzoriense]